MEDNINNRKYVGRLILSVLTERKNVREALKVFPESKDKNIECAYHALVHLAADEELRYHNFEYRQEQDDYLEFIAQTLSWGKSLPRNIIADYEQYYKGVALPWKKGKEGFWKEFLRFINLT